MSHPTNTLQRAATPAASGRPKAIPHHSPFKNPAPYCLSYQRSFRVSLGLFRAKSAGISVSVGCGCNCFSILAISSTSLSVILISPFVFGHFWPFDCYLHAKSICQLLACVNMRQINCCKACCKVSNATVIFALSRRQLYDRTLISPFLHRLLYHIAHCRKSNCLWRSFVIASRIASLAMSSPPFCLDFHKPRTCRVAPVFGTQFPPD